MAGLTEVKGISSQFAASLKEQGITDSDAFLEMCRTPQMRSELAAKLKADPKAVLELANRCDLIRIKGVAGVYADLLETAGVDTVTELGRRVPANLHARITEINTQQKLTQRPPTVEQVTAWVNEAKQMAKKLEY